VCFDGAVLALGGANSVVMPGTVPPPTGTSAPKIELPVPPDCVPTFTNKATALASLLTWDRKREPNAKVPLLMSRTIAHMFDVGLNTEGLFRVPGNSNKMQTIEDEFNKGRGADVDFKKRMVSCEDSASLLKKFLRDSLPEELFTSRLSDQFRVVQDMEQPTPEKKARFLELWAQLPEENRNVAYELIFFLVQVAANADLNKMSSENLGTVFGEMAGIPIRDGKALLKYLIEQFQDVFEEAAIQSAREMMFLRKLIGHYKSVLGMYVMGSSVVSIDSGGAINVWDTTRYTSKKRIKTDKRCYIAPLLVEHATAGPTLWAVFPDAVRIWQPQHMQLDDARVVKLDDKPEFTITLANTCAGVVVGDRVWLAGEKIELYDANTFQRVLDVTDHPAGQDVTLALGYACGYVWSWRSKTIHVWDPQTGAKVREIPDQPGKPTKFFEIHGCVWVPSEAGSITVIDPTTFQVRATLKQHNATVYCVVAVGPLVWSSSWDKSICAWDPTTLQFVRKIDNRHTDAISWMTPRWRQDVQGWDVWTGSWDRSIQVWFVPKSYADTWEGVSSTYAVPTTTMASPSMPPRSPSPSPSSSDALLKPTSAAASASSPTASGHGRRKSSDSGGHKRKKSADVTAAALPPPPVLPPAPASAPSLGGAPSKPPPSLPPPMATAASMPTLLVEAPELPPPPPAALPVPPPALPDAVALPPPLALPGLPDADDQAVQDAATQVYHLKLSVQELQDHVLQLATERQQVEATINHTLDQFSQLPWDPVNVEDYRTYCRTTLEQLHAQEASLHARYAEAESKMLRLKQQLRLLTVEADIQNSLAASR
jgi:hypothetical protein